MFKKEKRGNDEVGTLLKRRKKLYSVVFFFIYCVWLKNIRYLCEGNNIENDYFKKIEEVKYFKNHLMLKVKWINNIVFIQ